VYGKYLTIYLNPSGLIEVKYYIFNVYDHYPGRSSLDLNINYFNPKQFKFMLMTLVLLNVVYRQIYSQTLSILD
jgi:hypothetical protein